MELKINTILHSKDGRVVGNGIIKEMNPHVITIKTDYGNLIRLSESEVKEMFYIAWIDHENAIDIQHQMQRTHKNYTPFLDENESRDHIKFKTLRKNLGITQQEIAKIIGISAHVNISKFEKGDINTISTERYNVGIRHFISVEERKRII